MFRKVTLLNGLAIKINNNNDDNNDGNINNQRMNILMRCDNFIFLFSVIPMLKMNHADLDQDSS